MKTACCFVTEPSPGLNPPGCIHPLADAKWVGLSPRTLKISQTLGILAQIRGLRKTSGQHRRIPLIQRRLRRGCNAARSFGGSETEIHIWIQERRQRCNAARSFGGSETDMPTTRR